MQLPGLLGVLALLAARGPGDGVSAQDLRRVTEPQTPPTCVSLTPSGADDTAAIQAALDSCAGGGKGVALTRGDYNSGPLRIPSGAGLVVQRGATLKAIPDPRLYGPASCGTLAPHGDRCTPFILMSGVKGSGIYGGGTIDGQGHHKLVGSNMSWYDLTTHAGAGLCQNNPRLVQIRDSRDITVHNVTLLNSPYFHLVTYNTTGFTAWGVTVRAPADVGNTDAIDPTGSQNVTVAHCDISTGDDNVAISSLHSPARHISVLNNHFGHGNGMSIGSGTLYGVSDVLVSGLTLDGSVNGVHVKSDSLNGGLVENIVYQDICVRGAVKPIHLDMEYMNHTGSHTPHFRNISFNHMRVVTPGRFKFYGISASNQVQASLSDFHFTKGSIWLTSYANVTGTALKDATGSCGWAGNK
ncbi:endo-polygalacturonase-like [Bacillus rossius redtenbacheri]|uniref:endo-polygalacturonase-like n=1 Tax=Bacillus rossius redtenbacheri TaxID=93214 RepID=UPI002FDE1319